MSSVPPGSIYRLVDSTTEPISLTEAKEHLRIIDDDADDAYIEKIITAARHTVEKATRRSLWTGQTWQAGYAVRNWTCQRRLFLPKPPLINVSAVKYYDADNILQTLGAENYLVENNGSSRAELFFKMTVSLPSLSCDYAQTVIVTFTAGYAEASTLPGGLRQAMLYMIQHFYDNRSPIGINVNLNLMPLSLQYLCDQNKVPNIF